MSTEPTAPRPIDDGARQLGSAVAEFPPLDAKQVTELLVRHHDLHEGKFDLLIEFRLTIGAIGTSPTEALPGVAVGIAKLGLARALQPGASTVDASVVNPLKKKRASKVAKP
jgi:hypothetical protein